MLDGATRIDTLGADIRAWQDGDQTQPLHRALGLDADSLMQVARTPDALRYILYARRFGLVPPALLDSQARVVAHATQLAAATTDPFLLAQIESWQHESTERPTHA